MTGALGLLAIGILVADVMTVTIRDIYDLGDWTGSGRVRVRANDTVTLEITAERAP